MGGGWEAADEAPPNAVAVREAENALRQARRMLALIDEAVAEPNRFSVTPALLCELQALATDGLLAKPGSFRDEPSEILGSKHEPPPFGDVPALIEEMCASVTSACRLSAAEASMLLQLPPEMARAVALGIAVHQSAFVLWRLNWIHPFSDGNGRTARAASYLVFCWGLRVNLPGSCLIPERIVQRKSAYFNCLHDGDTAWKRRRQVKLKNLEQFLVRLFIAQLRER